MIIKMKDMKKDKQFLCSIQVSFSFFRVKYYTFCFLCLGVSACLISSASLGNSENHGVLKYVTCVCTYTKSAVFNRLLRGRLRKR